MENRTINVIIPLYNADIYIKQCITSLLHQSYSNWNAIIIDDGSTDNSYKECINYIANDTRFTIISKRNEGVSIARNRALNISKGDYIFFLDADDYLSDKDCFKKLMDYSEKYSLDYIRFEYYAVDTNNKILFNNNTKYLRKNYYYKSINPTKYCSNVARNEFFLCFSFFKNSIIQKNNIRFLEHCRMREDADFIIRYLYYCKKVMYIPDELYAYRKHNNAATATSINPKNYESDLKLVFDSLNTFKDKCLNVEYKKYLYKFLSILAAEQRCSIYAKYYFQVVNKFPVKSIRYKLSKYKFIEKIYLFILDTLRKINICTNMILK